MREAFSLIRQFNRYGTLRGLIRLVKSWMLVQLDEQLRPARIFSIPARSEPGKRDVIRNSLEHDAQRHANLNLVELDLDQIAN